MIPARAAFVGRDRELATLATALSDAERGTGSVLIVVGEPGIGKSRLVEELARTASDHVVAWGRCSESGAAPVYWPWTQVLRALFRKRDLSIGPDRLGARGAWLAEVVPEIRESLGESGRAPALEPEEARFRVFDAVASTLAEVAEARPLLVVLEDLHTADAASAALFEFVADQVRAARITLVATVRPVEAQRSSGYAALSRIAREGRAITLARLGREAVAEMLASLLESEPTDAFVDDLFRKTEGHPLFLREVAMRSRREQLGGGGAPATLGDAIAEHVTALSAGTRAVLTSAAVIGRDFDVALLARLEGRPVAEMTAPLAEGVDRGVVLEVAEGAYRFCHVLVAEALRERQPAEGRRVVHARLAALLRESSDPPWPQIAEHHLQGGDGEWHAAVGALREAANDAMRRFAFDEAAERATRALAVLEQHEPDPALRCELLLALADAHVAAGDVKRGQQACLLAIDEARRLDASELFARAVLALGSIFVFAQIDPRLISLLEEARSRLPDGDVPARALVTARLAAALQPARDPAGPIAMAEEAIAMARRIGDDAVLLDALRSGVSAMMDLAHPRLRAPYNREHVALATRLGRPLEALRGQMRLVFDHYELGDAVAAVASIDECERLVATLGHRGHRWKVSGLRAMQAIFEGRFADAERHRADARAESERTGDPNAGRALALQGLLALQAQGRFLDGLGAIPELELRCADLAFGPMMIAAARAALLANLGRADEARALIPDFIIEMVLGSPEHADLSTVATIAHVAIPANDRALLERLDVALAQHPDRFASWGMVAMAMEAPASGIRARVLARLGRADEADGLFVDARARARAAGNVAQIGWLALDHAELLGSMGGDRSEGVRAAVAEARGVAASLGLPAMAQRVAAVEQPSAAAPGGVSVPSVGYLRMTREGDVWIVESDGARLTLKDQKGLRLLAKLVDAPGREVHVLDLEQGGESERDVGDAGEAIDVRARDAYRKRAEELREALEEAERWNDAGRAERAREELEAIESELRSSLGLGGRARRSSSATERARVNAQRRLKDAIRRIGEQSPALARHLDWAVKTGTFCSYEPDPSH